MSKCTAGAAKLSCVISVYLPRQYFGPLLFAGNARAYPRRYVSIRMSICAHAHIYIYEARGTRHFPGACSCRLPCRCRHRSSLPAARASVPGSQPMGSTSTPPGSGAKGCFGVQGEGGHHPGRSKRGGWRTVVLLFESPAAKFLGMIPLPDHRPAQRRRVPKIRASLPAPPALPPSLPSLQHQQPEKRAGLFWF